uniref:Uncharacterized protein n=1 Tax=Lactuca sativa TaxID=4236 RepID=A0A9R1W3M6_LACSA|nr:hypothetical protein LSAT_V11C300153230 [Lactuca sativa]
MVDIDEFSVHELDAVMKGLRYGAPPVIYYHFLVPGGDFHFGLNPLGNDDDLRTFAQYVCDHKIMRVYTKHAEVQDLPSPARSSPVKAQPLHVEILQSNADVGEHVQVEVEEHVQDEVEEHSQVEVEENAQDEVELEHGHEAAMQDNLHNYMDNYIDNYMDDYMETEMEGNIENQQPGYY